MQRRPCLGEASSANPESVLPPGMDAVVSGLQKRWEMFGEAETCMC